MALKRKSTLRRTPLKKIGIKTKTWAEFRTKKLQKDSHGTGCVRCAKCGHLVRNPDLHHIIGRDERPDLYFDETNLIWLCRKCHELEHNNTG